MCVLSFLVHVHHSFGGKIIPLPKKNTCNSSNSRLIWIYKRDINYRGQSRLGIAFTRVALSIWSQLLINFIWYVWISCIKSLYQFSPPRIRHWTVKAAVLLLVTLLFVSLAIQLRPSFDIALSYPCNTAQSILWRWSPPPLRYRSVHLVILLLCYCSVSLLRYIALFFLLNCFASHLRYSTVHWPIFHPVAAAELPHLVYIQVLLAIRHGLFLQYRTGIPTILIHLWNINHHFLLYSANSFIGFCLFGNFSIHDLISYHVHCASM